MLFLTNSKNEITKKDLCLALAQGIHSVYPGTIESMARFLLLQYNIKTVNNLCNKNGDKNRKKGDEAKSEDKDNSNTSSAGVHVSDVTKPDV